MTQFRYGIPQMSSERTAQEKFDDAQFEHDFAMCCKMSEKIVGEEEVRILIRDMVTSFCKNRGNGIESKAREYVDEHYGFYLKGENFEKKVQQVLERIQLANKIHRLSDKIAEAIIEDINQVLTD